MTQEIHAPYHFVPLSKWVFMPDWAHLVSHDVPFEDGLSGVLEYQLTSHSPLCVGAEQIKQPNGASLVKFARDPLSRLVVPGSSLKGMIRSVLEIAAFGKFSQIDDQRLSFRDLSPKSKYMTERLKNTEAQSGWLLFDDKNKYWNFTPCEYAKIKHSDIKMALGIRIKNTSLAVAKYKALPLTKSVSAIVSAPKGKQNNRWVESLNQGVTKGNFVFTNDRVVNNGDSENYEFSYYFFDEKMADRKSDIAEQVESLFANHGEEQVNYLKRHGHPTLGIPVFALMKNGLVDSLGFAKMPRVSYKNSAHELVAKQNPAHLSDAYFDMAELMFGTLRDSGLGLKSRVTFTDAIAKDVTERDLYTSNLLVLNGPKPSFYPAYIEQKLNQSGYNDYDHDQPLAGTKRYLSKMPLVSALTSNVVGDNRNVASQMELCPVNKHFTGKIVFHNLKPVELGALLWCLQLEADVCHQLGHGKPMGAGAVTLSTKIVHCQANDQSTEAQTAQQYIDAFVQNMENVHPAKQWRQSPQIAYLLAIGNAKDNANIDTTYMDINAEEFQSAKDRKEKMPLLHDLPRTESVANYGADKTPSRAFAVGRLAGLFDKDNTWQVSVKEAQRKQQKADEEAALAEKAAAEAAEKKASLSDWAWRVDDLQMRLQGVDNTERAPLLREVITFFLETVDASEMAAATALYRLARDNEYHQKPKKRVAEQKAQLAALVSAYGIKL